MITERSIISHRSGIAISVCVSYGVCFWSHLHYFVRGWIIWQSCTLNAPLAIILTSSSTTITAKLAGQTCAVLCDLSLLPFLLDLVTLSLCLGSLDICCWTFILLPVQNTQKKTLSLAHTSPEPSAVKHSTITLSINFVLYLASGSQVVCP
ncbi:hypothetical protein E4T39_04508 [Aureobasidium subglaciale]|nr:hypothetical protein E4T39_04508 [Aureobasidium subglaciale]